MADAEHERRMIHRVFVRLLLKIAAGVGVVAMVCFTAVLSVSIASNAWRDAHVASAEFKARESEAIAEQRKNEVLLMAREVENKRAEVELAKMKNVGGPKTKGKK